MAIEANSEQAEAPQHRDTGSENVFRDMDWQTSPGQGLEHAPATALKDLGFPDLQLTDSGKDKGQKEANLFAPPKDTGNLTGKETKLADASAGITASDARRPAWQPDSEKVDWAKSKDERKDDVRSAARELLDDVRSGRNIKQRLEQMTGCDHDKIKELVDEMKAQGPNDIKVKEGTYKKADNGADFSYVKSVEKVRSLVNKTVYEATPPAPPRPAPYLGGSIWAPR